METRTLSFRSRTFPLIIPLKLIRACYDVGELDGVTAGMCTTCLHAHTIQDSNDLLRT